MTKVLALSTEAGTAAKTAVNGSQKQNPEGPKTENPEMVAMAKKVKELEEKLKEANKPRDIEAAILYFEEKKRKINQLEAFELVGQNLFEAKTEVENVSDPMDMNIKLFKLSLTKHNEYREGEKLLSVTNNPVILRAIDFLMEEVAKKVETLKDEIRG